MNTDRDPNKKPANRWVWGLLLLLVLALAVLLRGWNITTWSMWEDEEGSITLAQNPFHGFQGSFPIFFVALNHLLPATGFSVGAARLLPAVAGLASIALTYFCFRGRISPPIALLAALLIAVNFGHVFWSQSIRYYTTALVFQMLSACWCFEGFEKNRIGLLLLSNVAMVLALLTHFSALLLAPALAGYLIVILAWRGLAWRKAEVSGQSPNTDPLPATGYGGWNCFVFVGTMVVVLSLFAVRVMQVRGMLSGWIIPSARDPIHVGATVVAYLGVPMMGLALLAPWLARDVPPRVLAFLGCVSVIPVLELLVIAQLDVINVTWYYAFVAMIGFALLAASSLMGLWQRGHRATAGLLGGASLLYYGVFLGGYFTIMHGDRPRWEEAAQYLKQQAGIQAGGKTNPPVYASVPGVVAFYLGAEPWGEQECDVVRPVPPRPAAAPGEAWYVVEAKLVTPEYQSWFDSHCVLRAWFDARTGTVDRSVLVYHYQPPCRHAAIGP
jgi:hypothetical protein